MRLTRRLHEEDGQALIQVTIALFVLLGFVSLAIDVGNVYSERRRMQNAADAGALAGARQLCLGNGQTAARIEAERFMVENGVAPADIQAGDVTFPQSHLIDVTARETADTFIAGVIGVNEVDVGAGAGAACGAAKSACGLWPIAFSEEDYVDLYAEGAGCGKDFIVWNAENTEQEITCDADNDGTLDNVCDCYNCDPNGDGVQDFAILTSTSRGWLDFPRDDAVLTDTCPDEGCGSSELMCRIESDSGSRVEIGDCIPGIRGVRASARIPVTAREGDYVSIVVFDTVNCPSDSNCSGTEADTFHVNDLACVQVKGWDQQFVIEPRVEFSTTLRIERSKSIVVTLDCNNNCTTFCGSTDGTAPEPWQVKAVSLIR